jgi:hypothetical protein
MSPAAIDHIFNLLLKQVTRPSSPGSTSAVILFLLLRTDPTVTKQQHDQSYNLTAVIVFANKRKQLL